MGVCRPELMYHSKASSMIRIVRLCRYTTLSTIASMWSSLEKMYNSTKHFYDTNGHGKSCLKGKDLFRRHIMHPGYMEVDSSVVSKPSRPQSRVIWARACHGALSKETPSR